MKAYLLVFLIFTQCQLTSSVVSNPNEIGNYFSRGLVRSELSLEKNYKFEMHNSSHLAGYGVWTEYGTWFIKNDTLVLTTDYSVTDDNKTEKTEIRTMIKLENKLCELSSSNCFIKIE